MALKRILVSGGNGYVGGHICKEALRRGWHVTSVNRSGPPLLDAVKHPWITQVEWVKADITKPDDWKQHLEKMDGVIACVGGFGSHKQMEFICGDTNVVAAAAAAEAKVPRFTFVSAAQMPGTSYLMRGYLAGKAKAEEATIKYFPNSHTILRANFISGTREFKGMSLPLWVVGSPLRFLFGLPLFNKLHQLPWIGPVLERPVDVQEVAYMSCAGIAGDVSGILSPGDIIDKTAALSR